MMRALRMAGVMTLVHLMTPVPQAAAVAPPPVDRAYLPPPATPAPPGPTDRVPDAWSHRSPDQLSDSNCQY